MTLSILCWVIVATEFLYSALSEGATFLQAASGSAFRENMLGLGIPHTFPCDPLGSLLVSLKLFLDGLVMECFRGSKG